MARQDPTRDSWVGVIVNALAVGLLVFVATALANWVVG